MRNYTFVVPLSLNAIAESSEGEFIMCVDSDREYALQIYTVHFTNGIYVVRNNKNRSINGEKE